MPYKKSIFKKISGYIPSVSWLSEYSLKLIGNDAVSGLTLAAYAIPVSLAYATIAGLPPQYGVYGYLIGGFFYAFFGTGKQLAIGPTSAISMLLGVTLSGLAGGDTQRWVELASLTAFFLALMSVMAYLFKLSSIINFISETILIGFKAGAAITIAITQLPKLFGVAGGGENTYEKLYILVQQIHLSNHAVFLFGVIALVLLVAGEKLLPGKPFAILIVAAGIIVITFTPIGIMGFTTVGIIPSGIPRPHIPAFHIAEVTNILPLAFACFLLAYIESVSAAKTLAQKNNYEINSGQELLALGVANMATALGSGYPVSGGLSQSAVNEKAGAKTPVSLIIASIAIALCLIFFTGLLKNLPVVILAAIVIVAVSGLIDIKEFRRMYKVNKFDFIVAITALISVIIFGILWGVIIAALFSLILIIRSVSSPHVAFLGRIPGTNRYTDISRHPDNELIPGILIFRVESTLVYFNVSNVYLKIWNKIKESEGKINTLIFDMSTSANIDSAGVKLIKRLYHDLQNKNISFKLVEAHSEVRDILRKEKIDHLMGHFSRRDSLHDIVTQIIENKEPDIIKPAIKPSKKLLLPEVMSQIVLGNNYYTQTHPKEYYEEFSSAQKPYITLVTCSDSRVPLNALMPDTANKIFSIQNIGNQIFSSEGSVDYGVLHLKTPMLLFLGHSDCGAIKCQMQGFDNETYGIRHELDFLRPILSESSQQENLDTYLSQVIEKNLDFQVTQAFRKYKDLVKSGALTIVAGYYDFREEFGKGMGRIVFVNVNKIKKTEEMWDLPIFSYLSKTQKELHIGRLLK